MASTTSAPHFRSASIHHKDEKSASAHRDQPRQKSTSMPPPKQEDKKINTTFNTNLPPPTHQTFTHGESSERYLQNLNVYRPPLLHNLHLTHSHKTNNFLHTANQLRALEETQRHARELLLHKISTGLPQQLLTSPNPTLTPAHLLHTQTHHPSTLPLFTAQLPHYLLDAWDLLSPHLPPSSTTTIITPIPTSLLPPPLPTTHSLTTLPTFHPQHFLSLHPTPSSRTTPLFYHTATPAAQFAFTRSLTHNYLSLRASLALYSTRCTTLLAQLNSLRQLPVNAEPNSTASNALQPMLAALHSTKDALTDALFWRETLLLETHITEAALERVKTAGAVTGVLGRMYAREETIGEEEGMRAVERALERWRLLGEVVRKGWEAVGGRLGERWGHDGGKLGRGLQGLLGRHGNELWDVVEEEGVLLGGLV